MSVRSLRTPIDILTILTAGIVGSYVFAVSQRVQGGVTHLGEDTIALVYLSLLVPLLVSVCLAIRYRQRGRYGWLGLMAIIMPSTVLAGWLYLHLRGSVIGYSEWIRRVKSDPNHAVNPIGGLGGS